ncbi:hypothetical protein KSP40_PGU013295 [Platanthera guangdongensis]|uniref:Uncharacterized protein n=1 Tax=Platanthera guangdongensis TaxID=2320717 RepID=A0ABR2LG48_9ASPA
MGMIVDAEPSCCGLLFCGGQNRRYRETGVKAETEKGEEHGENVRIAINENRLIVVVFVVAGAMVCRGKCEGRKRGINAGRVRGEGD